MVKLIIKKYIEEGFYKKIVQNIPLCCVDIVLANKNKFLLVKRKKIPAANKWWFLGGRLLFGEDLKTAPGRKLKEELGIKKLESIKFLTIGENRWKKGYFNLPAHTINITYLVKINDKEAKSIKLEKENHRDYQWLDKTNNQFGGYLKKILKLAGFKKSL